MIRLPRTRLEWETLAHAVVLIAAVGAIVALPYCRTVDLPAGGCRPGTILEVDCAAGRVTVVDIENCEPITFTVSEALCAAARPGLNLSDLLEGRREAE